MNKEIIMNKVNNTINYTTKQNNDTLTESNLICCPRGLSKNSIKRNKIVPEKIDEEHILLHSLTMTELTDIIDRIKKIKTSEDARYNIELFTSIGPITYNSRMITKKELNKLTSSKIFENFLLIKYDITDIYGVGVSAFKA